MEICLKQDPDLFVKNIKNMKMMTKKLRKKGLDKILKVNAQLKTFCITIYTTISRIITPKIILN